MRRDRFGREDTFFFSTCSILVWSISELSRMSMPIHSYKRGMVFSYNPLFTYLLILPFISFGGQFSSIYFYLHHESCFSTSLRAWEFLIRCQTLWFLSCWVSDIFEIFMNVSYSSIYFVTKNQSSTRCFHF